VQQFNTAVKQTLKKLMTRFKGWGALWCNEVGFNNTNLHAHVLFYGPYIAQSELATIWNEISGNEVVWISEAKGMGLELITIIPWFRFRQPRSKND
jgi:hypothetical protein